MAKQGASGNIVLGNYIGTDATGKLDTASIPGPVGPQIVPLGNAHDGVVVANNSTDPSVSILNDVIGGQNTNGQLSVGNLISGNLDDGVLLAGPRVTVNTMAGNYIGTDKSGTQALANASAGVELNVAAGQTTGVGPSRNLIGGGPGDGNVISSNGTPAQGTNAAAGEGVLIANGSNANILEGNYIGTTASGLAPLANVNGVVINNAANNVVGDFNNDNVISGNTVEGVLITGSQATGNYVQNNRIGTAQDFSTSIPNQDGVVINNQASGNFVGNVVTLTSGSIALLGNTIAGNTGFGVQIAGSAANNQVMANGFGIVEGIDLRRGTPQAGNGTGIQILDSASNIIGGTTANARNFIENSLTDGVNIQDTNGITGSGTVVTTGNRVEGDYIGVANDGSTKLANGGNGISIDSAAGNTIGIGDDGQGAGKVISGSALSGVVIDGMAATGNKVAGNDIGTSADGTTAVPNLNGVEIENGATVNFVGLAGNAGGNIISGNSQGHCTISQLPINTFSRYPSSQPAMSRLFLTPTFWLDSFFNRLNALRRRMLKFWSA